jgi:hypothetical protein
LDFRLIKYSRPHTLCQTENPNLDNYHVTISEGEGMERNGWNWNGMEWGVIKTKLSRLEAPPAKRTAT